MLILNIGTCPPHGWAGKWDTHKAAFDAARVLAPRCHTMRYEGGTIVAIVDGSVDCGALAYELNQDCIAVFDPATGDGRFAGPRRELHGAFDRNLFKF